MKVGTFDNDIIELANDMLDKLNVSRRVDRREDIDSGLFVTLFEGLCGDSLKGRARMVRQI
jgi:hypothetical protein